MSTEKIVVGLDIGTTKVCAIVGKKNEFGKINILGFGKAESDGVSRGVVVNIDKTVEAIRKAVAEAEKQSGVDINVVYVGIAGEHIRSMQHKGIITLSNPDMEISAMDVKRLHDDMFKIATPPGMEILHVLPQEYTVDNQVGIKDPVGMSGVRLEGNFHVVTGQTTAANNIYKCVRKAGLEARELILEPLASSAAVLTDEEREAGVCLVDIGGGTTDLAIFEDNIIRHTAVIPFGGNIVTEDIKQGCSVMRRQAELLKLRFGSALATEMKDDEIITITGLQGRPPKEIRRRTLSNIIQSRMEEIVEFVAAEIKHSGYEKKLVGGIVVTGGGSMLAHTKQLIEFVTGIDTRIGMPGEHLASGLVDEVNSPMYATSTGLVIEGLHSGEVPAREHEHRQPAVEERPSAKKEKTPPTTPPRTPSERPNVSFIGRVKDWFENTMTNTGDFIE
ncbi:MAG: cell division protein FtsA [Bacteroidetes bacterium]|nr:cell division protein FtsA [Bacteroidota bacterium]